MNSIYDAIDMSRLPLICTVILALAASAPAQPVDTLTVEEAVDRALTENLELRQAAFETARQEAALGQERLSLLPNVSFTTYSSRRYGLSFDQTAGRLTQTATDYVSGSVGASLTLFDGFGRVASLKEAGRRVDAAEHAEQWTRQTIVAQVLRQFLQVVTARERVQIRQADLEAQRQLLAEVEELIDVGRVAASDLYQQREALAASESRLLEARRELHLARLALAQTLGRRAAKGLHFEAPPVDTTNLAPGRYDAEALSQKALDRRADLKSQRASVEAAGQNLRGAKSTFWPQISISAGYGSSYSSAAGSFGFDEQLDRNRGGSVGLSLRFPITGWLTGRQQVRQAQIAEKSARLQTRRAERQAIRQVEEARLTYEYYEKQLEVTERRLTAAETALEGAEERYRQGLATIVDLAETRARYVEARSQRAQTIYQFIFQEKLLEYQTGGLTPGADVISGRYE